MGFLDTASAWLDSTLASADGLTITYRRGGATVSITDAVVGQTEFAQETEGQVVATWRGRDYFVSVASLLLEGIAVTPRAGDVIEQVFGGNTKQYEVLSIGSEPCFRYTGPDEVTYRIHTKLMGVDE